IEQAGEQVSAKAVSPQQEHGCGLLHAEEMQIGMKDPKNRVLVSAHKEVNACPLRTVLRVAGETACDDFGGVNERPQMKFSLAVNEMYACGRHVRIEPGLRLKAVRRNEAGQQNKSVDRQQEPDGPGELFPKSRTRVFCG